MPKNKKEQKRADGLAMHKKLQKEKEEKRKQRKKISLPTQHTKKGKK